MDTGELLRRLSTTLRTDIGPAVTDEYTRTQAFMASVILERLARQVSLGPVHAAAEQADIDRLHPQLEKVLAAAPPDVVARLAEARAARTVDSLGPLIAALHRWEAASVAGAGAGADRPVARSLELIRPVLRADIDRRMEIAT